jgi:hypothetical protein
VINVRRTLRYNARFFGRYAAARPVVAMTAGTPEENMHNFTAWRDVLDPYLTDLLHRVWA